MGKAINPDMVRSQMEGGAVQGLSTALLESIIMVNGKPLNASFTDYRIATHRRAGRDGEHHRRGAAGRRSLRRARAR
ncbi:MAG: molybdopterin cofactor-binding domain-containing protein [Caldilineales bacterium]